MSSRREKLVPIADAAERCAEWRNRGERVVLTNGAFDLLHVGHLRYLEAAAELADHLVVAINSDFSVRLSKGEKRPIVPERERVELVSHIAVVDLIVVFDDETVGPVLTTLKPDIHAKGTDYTVENVPERSIVEAYGGRTAICGDPKDHATTDVIAVILDRFGGDESS